MENKNTFIDVKIGNLNELTKALSVKEQTQEQLLVVMKVLFTNRNHFFFIRILCLESAAPVWFPCQSISLRCRPL